MHVDVPIGTLLALVLVSTRILAWSMVAPPLATGGLPKTVKTVVSVGLALAIVPTVKATAPPAEVVPIASALVEQVLVGAGLGFLTRLLFAAVESAGALLDVFGGFSLAQGFDPLSMNTNTVFGKFHQMLAMILLFVSGGHLVVIGGLLRTFHFLPLGTTPDWEAAPDVLMTAFGLFFTTAVQIALPMIAVLFMADLGLALLTKSGVDIPAAVIVGAPLVLGAIAFLVLRNSSPKSPLIARTDP